MRQLARLRTALVGPDEAPLEERFYQAMCLLVASGSLLVVVGNSFQQLPAIVNIGGLCVSALAVGLYALGRRKRLYPGAMLLGVTIALVVGWFPNAASDGSIAFFFLGVISYAVLFFDGWRRRLAVGGSLALVATLLWLDYLYPAAATRFQRPVDRVLDLTSGFLISALLSVAMFRVVLGISRRERDRLTVSVQQATEAQREAAESRATLSALIEGTDDPVWLADPRTFELMLFNSAVVANLAPPGVEVARGLRLDGLLPSEGVAAWKAHYAAALQSGHHAVEFETPWNGRTFLFSLNPVRHDGTLVGIAGFGKDITEHKRAEAERDRVAQQVLEAHKMESLGSLAGGVAHDFNNMLAGIMGYAELLHEDERDESRRQHLDAILRAARRSSDLTRKLLAFARRGKNVVEAVDLNAVARDTLAMLRPSLGPDVRVALHQGTSWTVDGDPSQMNQLLLNLCVNANEAMADEGVLGVRTSDAVLTAAEGQALGLEPGEYVCLEVSDTGHGMTDEVKAHIFEPFFTTKAGSDQAGTGLGLSTVYGVVHLHEGTIDVVSAPGRGTRFTVFLPKGRASAASAVAAPASERGAGLVLVVDDEELLRGFTTAALRRLGYGAVTAADGEEGVRVFRERHGELTGVILDLKMPRKSGVEAFDEMRVFDASVPVLVCSGYGENEEAQQLISRGARGMLSKPFTLADLSEQLNRMRRTAARS
jgi:signal transduction histidine kinase/CheY-like chemotaxis protein